MEASSLYFTCNREILGAHANPLAYRWDLNDANAGVCDGGGGGDGADVSYADVRGDVSDEQRLFDDANDDGAVRPQQHFAHALQPLLQILHRHRRMRPLHGGPRRQPMVRPRNHHYDDPFRGMFGLTRHLLLANHFTSIIFLPILYFITTPDFSLL